MMKWLAFGLALALASSAHAQNAVTQNGAVVPRDVAQWARDRTIQDPGGLTGRTADGLGVNPFSITDNNGLALCANNVATLGPYQAFCMGHKANGDALLSVRGGGGLSVDLNGVTFPITGSPPAGNSSCVVAETFGMNGDGVTDNKAAFDAYIAAQGSNGICISFHTGYTYYFASAPNLITLAERQSFYLYGNRSKLLFHNSNGLSVKYTVLSGFNISGSKMLIADTDFVTDSTGFIGLGVNGGPIAHDQLPSPTYLQRNRYYGTGNSTGGPYWGIARQFVDTSQIFVDGEYAVGRVAAYLGIGLDIQGTSNTVIPSVANVSNEQDFWLQTGINVHGYFEGLNVGRGSNFVGLQNGVVCDTPTAQRFQCDVHNNSFSVTDTAVKINNWVDSTISGNDISGGVFNGTPPSLPGLIVLQGATAGTIISNNHIEGLPYGNGNINKCIELQGVGATNTIVNNNYMQCNKKNLVATGNPVGLTMMGNRRDGALNDGSVSGHAAPYIIADLSGIEISSNNVTDGDIRWNGHVGPHSPTSLPTLTCGAGATNTGGGDSAGTIVMNTPFNLCSMNFARNHTEYSTCVVTSQTTPPPHFQYITNLTGFTASWPGDPNQTLVLNYICMGN